MPRAKKSPYWQYFKATNATEAVVVCQVKDENGMLCGEICKRGLESAKKGTLSTTPMIRHHYERHHKDIFAVLEKKRAKQKVEEEKKAENNIKKAALYVLHQKKNKENKDEQGRLVPSMFPQPYKRDFPKQKQLDYDLGQLIIESGSPINIVESKSFKTLIRNLTGDPRLSIPSRARITDEVLPEMVGRIKQLIKLKLQKSCAVGSVTTDMWSSESKDDYMSYTLHFIDEEWERKMVLLATLPFDLVHTGANIGMEMGRITDDWGLDGKIHLVCRDNASIMISALREAGMSGIGCFLHILHLVVSHSIKHTESLFKLMKRIQRNCVLVKSSKPVKDEYEAAQAASNLPKHRLILPGENRWSGGYQMMSRYFEQKQAIVQLTSSKIGMKNNMDILNGDDWEFLEQALEVLSKIAKFTAEMQGAERCISEVIPSVRSLRKNLFSFNFKKTDEFDDELYSEATQTSGKALVANLQEYLDGYFLGAADSTVRIKKDFTSIEENTDFTFAMLLDPRMNNLKDCGFSSETNMFAAVQSLIKKVEVAIRGEHLVAAAEDVVETPSTLPEPNTVARSTTSSGNLWDDDREEKDDAEQMPMNVSRTPIEMAEDEVNGYRRAAKSGENVDPLRFWKAHKLEYPHCAKLARAALSAPLGTPESERTFKTSADQSKGDRSRRLPSNVQMMTFLRYNLRAVNYDVFGLPAWDKENDLLIEGIPRQLEVVEEPEVTEENYVSIDNLNDLEEDVFELDDEL